MSSPQQRKSTIYGVLQFLRSAVRSIDLDRILETLTFIV